MIDLGLGIPLEFADDEGFAEGYFTPPSFHTTSFGGGTGGTAFGSPRTVPTFTPTVHFSASDYLASLRLPNQSLNRINQPRVADYSGSPVGAGNSWLAKFLNTGLAIVASNNQTKQVQSAGYNNPNPIVDGGNYPPPPPPPGNPNPSPNPSPNTDDPNRLSADKTITQISEFIKVNGLILALGAGVYVLYKSGRT